APPPERPAPPAEPQVERPAPEPVREDPPAEQAASPEPEPESAPEPPRAEEPAQPRPAEPQPPAAPAEEEPFQPRGIRPVGEGASGTVRRGGTESPFSRSGEVPTPRRRVIFDEGDDLDVPDFLK
ncbi:cell division protein FtsZ, partial [Marinitenerispora sediminis]